MGQGWKTAISKVVPGSVNLRGHSLKDVILGNSFTDGIYLTIRGKLPDEGETRVLNAMLNTLLDHGFVASTVVAARVIASGNPEFVPAVAGGLLAAGRNTVSPEHSAAFIANASKERTANGWTIEEAARRIAEDLVVQRARVPGFGHPSHKDGDFRAIALRQVAEENGLIGERTLLYEGINREYCRASGRDLPVNIDGMLAAVMTEMGFKPREMAAIALLSVFPGLMAHVIEEIDQGTPLRHVPPEESQYIGMPLADSPYVP